MLCCGYTLTDFPISIRLTSLALGQSNDCPSASKATLMNMDKYFMWVHYERLHNHNKARHNKSVCIFLGVYCRSDFAICNENWWVICNRKSKDYMYVYELWTNHYNDVIMSARASQITSLTNVYSTVSSGADQRKHQSSASLAFVRRIHRWPVNHNWLLFSGIFIYIWFLKYQENYQYRIEMHKNVLSSMYQ